MQTSTPSQVQAVLFDLDGTLLDTAPDFTLVVNKLLEAHNREALDPLEIRNAVSRGARALVSLAFDITTDHEQFNSLLEELLDLYSENLHVASRPFPGIVELLRFLQQHSLQWGIVTNKPVRFTEPLLAAINLDPPCDTVICPDHVQNTKPHPEPLLLACKQLDCDPGQAIYIGDHLRDIEAGRQAGMYTIAATYGYLDQDENVDDWQADAKANSVTQIHQIISQRLLLPDNKDT
jgi:phosphoglycolate phosphatase